MADNVTLSLGTGDGATIATDDDGVAQHQYVKVEFGADNTQTKVTSSVGLPVNVIDNFATAAEGSALGEGVLLQGDDGLDRKNINVDATTGDVQVDVTNTVTVDGSGVTQPVSGTVTANLSATDNAVLDSIAAAVNGTLTVGSHAVTNAGTFATQVDGDALTALQLIDDIIFTDDTSTHTPAVTKVAGVGAVATPTDTTVEANDIGMLAMSTDRRLHTDTQIVGQDANLTVDLGTTDSTALDNIKTSVQLIDNAISGTEMQVDVIASLPAGTNAIGKLAANSGVDIGDVTINNAAGASAVNIQDGGNTITVDGTVTANLGSTDNAVLDDIAAKLAPHTTNGHSFYLNQDTNAVASVKASAGTIYWISCMSIDTTPVYLNLYNVASGSVTLGTTTPSLQFIVPAQSDGNGAGFTINFGPLGIQFDTAITIAAATTYNGSTDPGANVVITNIGYE